MVLVVPGTFMFPASEEILLSVERHCRFFKRLFIPANQKYYYFSELKRENSCKRENKKKGGKA